MKTSVSLIVSALSMILISEVNCTGLFEAIVSIKPCLDKASQKKISLVAALTAPEDWYEKCFVACLAKKMGNDVLWEDHRCYSFFELNDLHGEAVDDEEANKLEQANLANDEPANDEHADDEQADDEQADDEQADDKRADDEQADDNVANLDDEHEEADNQSV